MSTREVERITVTNALIFDGRSPDLVEGDIVIEDGVITEVGSVTRAQGQVVDARGNVVMPGLIDAHFHAYAATLDSFVLETTDLSYLALMAERRLGAALGRGFTTVRDVAGGDAGLARGIAEGLIRAPRYFYTGAALSQTGGHGDVRSPDQDFCLHSSRMTEVVDGPENLRRAVRERFRAGAHAIKVMTSGGVISPSDPIRIPQYSAEELRVVVEEATRRGSYVAAHAYSPEAIAHSVKAGIRSIEHGNLMDAATAALMAEHGTYLVPTLAAYDALERRGPSYGLSPVSQAKNREVLDSGKRAIELARQAGVPIGFGSDLMGELESDQLIGVRLQIEVDGALATMRSLTSVNSALLGMPELGSIGVGSAGDLLVLDGNPLENPAALWDESLPRTVIRSGTVVS
ncbi:amidohydrolase family protein [Nakamurella silvestris]|nr:amidohydrolase family protein [Nakamurella silvestris]